MSVDVVSYIATTVIGDDVFVSVDDLLLWLAASLEQLEQDGNHTVVWTLTAVTAGLVSLAVAVREASCPT